VANEIDRISIGLLIVQDDEIHTSFSASMRIRCSLTVEFSMHLARPAVSDGARAAVATQPGRTLAEKEVWLSLRSHAACL